MLGPSPKSWKKIFQELGDLPKSRKKIFQELGDLPKSQKKNFQELGDPPKSQKKIFQELGSGLWYPKSAEKAILSGLTALVKGNTEVREVLGYGDAERFSQAVTMQLRLGFQAGFCSSIISKAA